MLRYLPLLLLPALAQAEPQEIQNDALGQRCQDEPPGDPTRLVGEVLDPETFRRGAGAVTKVDGSGDELAVGQHESQQRFLGLPSP